MSMSIDERIGTEPLRCDDCGVARQAADAQAESARVARRAACLRGFAIVRAAFETWRDGDKGVPADDTDVFLALQALARALEKK